MLFNAYVILHPVEKGFVYFIISLIFGITYCFLFFVVIANDTLKDIPEYQIV